MNTVTYTEWLAEGQKNVAGKVDFLDNTGRSRYMLLQPDLFPEMRIYLSILDWSDGRRHKPGLVGSRVLFDLPAQEIRRDQKAVAANIRFVDRS